MQVTNIRIDKLKPYEKNPRINSGAVNYVVNSIKANGFNQPLVVDQNNIVCVGHTRLLAAKELGLKEVPCYVKSMTKEQFIAYNLADNKTSEYSQWDKDLLKENMMELNLIDDSMLIGTGFDQDYIDHLLGDLEDETNYGDKNKEIDTDSFGDELDQQCPKCSFQFSSKK